MRDGFEVDLQVGVEAVVAKVVLLEHGIANVVAPPAHVLHCLFANLKRVHHVVLVDARRVVALVIDANDGAEQIGIGGTWSSGGGIGCCACC